MGIAESDFRYTKGTPKGFSRPDLENPVSREFCPNCGTHIITKLPGGPMAALKVGTLDDPSVFKPDMAIWTVDKQLFHTVPEGIPSFDRMPG